MTQAAGGPLGSQPVTALRRISLRTGSEQDIRARGGAFAGRLGAVLDGVLLFSGGQGVTAYSARTGKLLWRRAARCRRAWTWYAGCSTSPWAAR